MSVAGVVEVMLFSKIFVDAFWNSRRRPFHLHLYDLMRSWALVCDVWYLEPQVRQAGESASDFAARVKRRITETAGLVDVDYDGYMKYFVPSDKYVREKQRLFAEALTSRLGRKQ
jgi:glycerol-3-phosphate O-acyltransferase 3/4